MGVEGAIYKNRGLGEGAYPLRLGTWLVIYGLTSDRTEGCCLHGSYHPCPSTAHRHLSLAGSERTPSSHCSPTYRSMPGKSQVILLLYQMEYLPHDAQPEKVQRKNLHSNASHIPLSLPPMRIYFKRNFI